MARGYQPSTPFIVPMRLLIPTETYVKGVRKLTYPDPDTAPMFYGSIRTFGGTEQTVNGVYTVVDTAVIDTWYRPDIQANCRIVLVETEDCYEIIGNPENISMRNQFLQIRVRKIGQKGSGD